jgi:hypothetical protein
MRKTASLIVALCSLFSLGCSDKTQALANRSLMARPLLHQHASPSVPGKNAADKPAQTATAH